MNRVREFKVVKAGFLLVFILIVSGCKGKDETYKVQTLRSMDGKTSITFISSEKVKWKEGDGPEIEAEYENVGKNMLRVEIKQKGKEKTMTFSIAPEGLEDKQGNFLYSEFALVNKKKEMASVKKEEERLNSGEFKEIVKKYEALLVPVKGGCFQMGDTFNEGEVDEAPPHKACLDDFQIDKYEVTQQAYLEVMRSNPSAHTDCMDCPVDKTTWMDAEKFCKTIGKRLPTEAEWEYAAREGGKDVRYGFGKNEISKNDANYDSEKSMPVGKFAPNALGIYDMSGNVYEWALDFYSREYYKNSPEKNPKYVESGRLRVLRGGSWNHDAEYLRSSSRFSSSPFYKSKYIGFRCAK
ncbi:sulfatase-modifying factor protein [hydrothermal vent metagenome]|uniref:Sulfatase-modifying factor protein n=1 Tax=hydrothermal vent metagenome TaxID=652676 RepID=A0A3B1C028_9ZZZZ